MGFSEQYRVITHRSDIIIHPEFDRHRFLNDIALIRLSKPFTFDMYVGSIQLPLRTYAGNYLVGRTGVASGWGNTGFFDDKVSDELRFVHLVVEHRDTCFDYYETDGEVIGDGEVCANTANGTRGICEGDSGGPFVVLDRLVGISSYISPFGCQDDSPVVFTGVVHYLDWIKNVTSLNV